jgi:all-trans-8'-apo-beta-carotenal 15,15'-oxygenase
MNRRKLLKASAFSSLSSTGLFSPFSNAKTWQKESAFVTASRAYQGVDFKGTIATDRIPVRGKIPQELRGTLYRNGAAKFSRGETHYKHWFDGDGMVQAFTFEEGKASHRGVLLQTPKLIEESQAGRFLYNSFGTEIDNPRAIGSPDQVNTANINILSMRDGRELYALWEGGSALELNPQTLAAKKLKAWSPSTAGAPFSAHPRRSPDGTLWNFGYAPHSSKLIIYEIDTHGTVKRETLIEAPQVDMVHDFAITENYLVFLLMPLEARSGTSPVGSLNRYEWNSGNPMIAMLIKKSDFSTRYFDLPNGGVFHLGNAWEEKGMIRLAYARYSKFLEHLKGLIFPSPSSLGDELATWYSVEISLETSRAKQISTDLIGVEFPSFDLRRTGEKTDFTVLTQNTHSKLGDGYRTYSIARKNSTLQVRKPMAC